MENLGRRGGISDVHVVFSKNFSGRDYSGIPTSAKPYNGCIPSEPSGINSHDEGSSFVGATSLTIGGSVSGLLGGGLVLQYNGGNNLAISGQA